MLTAATRSLSLRRFQITATRVFSKLSINTLRDSILHACVEGGGLSAPLRTNRLYLYMLRWRFDVQLTETIDTFEQLKRDGKVHHWGGVNNFDAGDIDKLTTWSSGSSCQYNQ